jgi:3-hydroxyisobutyrate dehydrogenase-like beta-hydroxyacid dehydrogenase
MMAGMGEPATHRVGVVGVGRMGLPVCLRLLERGFDVVATDLIAERRAPAVAAGAAWAGDARAAAASADIVITLLPGPDEVASVAGDVAAAMVPGAVWVDMSTAGPRPPLPWGARALDAPVGGGPGAARHGGLHCFAGATAGDLEAARPVLEALTDRIVHVGPPGSGYVVKLLANLLWFEHAVAVSEALTVARRAGLDVDVVRDALGHSAAASRFLSSDAGALLRGDDLSSFSLARCCRQLESILALGDELAVPLDLPAAVLAVHREALRRYGDVDGELLGARFVAERGGVSFGPGHSSA